MIPHSLLVKRLDHCLVDDPIRSPAYPGDVGYDLCVNIDKPVTIEPHGKHNFGTGIAVEISLMWPFSSEVVRGLLGKIMIIESQIRPRSSTYARHNLTVHHGTLDLGYRGEISTFVSNPNPTSVIIHPGSYISQLVIAPTFVVPIVYVNDLSHSERGTAGFGSSDAKLNKRSS